MVTPKLKRRQTAEILLLGTLYMGFAFYHDIRIDNDGIPADLDFWALPVTFLEVCFVAWTYHGLSQVRCAGAAGAACLRFCRVVMKAGLLALVSLLLVGGVGLVMVVAVAVGV